ncbi:DNA-directed RNA polymerase subunit B'', partial [Candidatus Woesearchaeota archaeon]|nr:DNA-directed RNA polymerase subunit B'' [Candidatus Woesearchaeota archaeon]
SNIHSFNRFAEKDLQRIVDEVGEVVPTIIPQEFENYKIKLSGVKIGMPEITEADGSRRILLPREARLRHLTYAAPISITVSAHINGVQRESFVTEIGKLPVMLKSKFCHLTNMKEEELIKAGEDPADVGGYFILNGNERVLIAVEDLASNKLFIKKAASGPSKFTAKLYSEQTNYRIPHTLEQMKDGILHLSFARFRRVPIISLIKALGLVKDQDIMQYISTEKIYDDVILNIYESRELKNQDEAVEFLAKRIGLTQKELRAERTLEQLDRYLLPHLGMTSKDRMTKAYNLCKLIKRFILVATEGAKTSDQDHYVNKRLKLSGDLLEDLFRVNMRSLVQDMLYNFQRLVKRGKFNSIRIVIREQLLSSRIKSAMATGSWPGGRTGISQNISRTNAVDATSHLQRVVSLLTSSQENFEARALHSTHWGRLCPVETPEGTPIGLRKNLAMLASITEAEVSNDKIIKQLETLGLKK